MKKALLYFSLIVLVAISCNNSSGKDKEVADSTNIETKAKTNDESQIKGAIQITTEQFKELIFDYTTSNEWKFKGDKPCMVDFYADWCRPCRMTAPILDELAVEYAGKINIYKVNVDKEAELANIFGIQSIPTIIFCPLEGQAMLQTGAYPKAEYIQFIESILIK